jgi:hypothetical protein
VLKNNSNEIFLDTGREEQNTKDQFFVKKTNPVYSQTSSTIYKVLGNKKNEFIETLRKQRNRSEEVENLLIQKKKFFSSNMMTHYLGKKGKEAIPYVFPIALISKNDYGNSSEKNRYEKISQLFLNLKYFIENDDDNEKTYIKEFMMKHGIYDDNYYTIDKINNFINFLNSGNQINPTKNIQEIIIEATQFGENGSQTQNPINSRKPKNLGKFKKKSLDSLQYGNDILNMNNYLSIYHPILDSKRFTIDINNPKQTIDELEMEFDQLKKGVGGLNFNLNDTNGSKKNRLKKKNINRIMISANETNKDSLESKIFTPKLFNNPAINLQLSKYRNGNKNELKSSTSYLTESKKEITSKSLKQLNSQHNFMKSEMDLSDIKKKNKLLEYIVLQRSRSKYKVLQDLKNQS